MRITMNIMLMELVPGQVLDCWVTVSEILLLWIIRMNQKTGRHHQYDKGTDKMYMMVHLINFVMLFLTATFKGNFPLISLSQILPKKHPEALNISFGRIPMILQLYGSLVSSGFLSVIGWVLPSLMGKDYWDIRIGCFLFATKWRAMIVEFYGLAVYGT